MTFVISGKILVDGQQAKFELAATAAEILKLRGGQKALAEAAAQGTTTLQAQINTLTGVRSGFSSAAASAAAFTEALDARDEFNALRASVDPLFASSQRLAQAQEIVARAIEKGGIEASQAMAILDQYEANLGRMTAGHGQATAAIGNLTAQWNDVFVMMAAGQNPMQLAIQQGMQITQVIGPMGAAGAVKALGAGFLAMLSPMNLVLIGGLAGAVALGQSLMGVGEEAVTLDGAIDELSQSIEDYQGFVKLAATDTAELRERFGQFAGQVQGFAEYMAGVQLATTMDELRESITPLKTELADVERAMRDVAMAREAVASAQSQLDAGFGNPEQLLRAQEALALFEDNAQGVAASLGLTVDQAAQLAAMLDGLAEARSMADIAAQAGEALAFIEQMVPAGSDLPPALRPAVAALEEMQRKAAEAAADTQRLAEEAGRAANEAERLAGAAPGAGWMATAIGETNALISRLVEANRIKNALANLAAVETQGLASQYAQYGAGREAFNQRAREASPLFTPFPVPAEGDSGSDTGSGTGTGSGTRTASGRAAATRAETSAVERLIERRTEELELLRETDPVSREMIRNRELLASATEAQRNQIEQVTAALERGKAVEAASDFFSNSAADFLRDVRRSAGDASEAIDKLIDKLIDAGIQALMLGEGPLAGLFGTRGRGIGSLLFGGGGLFGGIFGGGGGTGAFGLPMPFADGGGVGERTGMIYGQGGPRDDKELILASPGEFIVNARATAQHRALLEAINDGGVPRFADGGTVVPFPADRRPASEGEEGRDAVSAARTLVERAVQRGSIEDTVVAFPTGGRRGQIYGQGGPRDDKELIFASPGEFVVNARAATRNRNLLEELNSGRDVPRFADGGLVGGRGGPFDDLLGAQPVQPGSDGLQIDISIPISIDARGSERGVEDRIEARLAELVPGIVRRAVDDAVAKVADKMGRGGLR